MTDLARVNLVAGVNNVGKTALLEALFVHCGAYKPELTLRLNSFRGIESVKIEQGEWAETPWDSLFADFDTSRSVEFVGENEAGSRRVVTLRVARTGDELARVRKSIQGHSEEAERDLLSPGVAKVLALEYEDGEEHGKYHMILDQKGARVEPIPPAPPFQTFFLGARVRVPLSEQAEQFGKLEVRNKQDVVLQVLQLIEPRLKRLAIVVVGGQPMLHGDLGGGRLAPLPVMGDGMVRLADLVLRIGNASNGVVLVDEFENGVHHSILPDVWRAVGNAARQFNTQLFATTHSLECIAAAHRSLGESAGSDFRLHRLERVKGTIRAVTYTQTALGAAIETGLEVR